MIAIPESVAFYWGDPVNRAAINVLAGSTAVPGDLTLAEAGRFELANLAARRVRVEYWTMTRTMDSGELKRRFGRTVQGFREAKGLTQEQLADRIGRSVDTVSNIERGVNATRIEVAYQLSVELGIELPRLFDFADRPTTPTPSDTSVRATVADLLAACDEATAGQLLDLLRIGLKLKGAR